METKTKKEKEIKIMMNININIDVNDMMKDLENTFKVFEDTYPRIKEIKYLESFGALLGVIIDQYAADHDIKTEEMTKILEGLVKAHKEINKNMGRMGKSI